VNRVCTQAGGTIHSLLSDGTDWAAIRIAPLPNEGWPCTSRGLRYPDAGGLGELADVTSGHREHRGRLRGRGAVLDRASALGPPAGDDAKKEFGNSLAVTATRAAPPTTPALKKLRQPRVRRLPRSELARWPLGLQIGAVPPRVHVMLGLHHADCVFQFE
jgi:hypothetical protein